MQLTKVHLVGYILCAGDKNPLKPLSCVRLFVTPWAVAYQAPPSIGFSRQEYWSGLLFPSPGDPPDPGIEPVSFTLQAFLHPGRVTRTQPRPAGQGEGPGHGESGRASISCGCGVEPPVAGAWVRACTVPILPPWRLCWMFRGFLFKRKELWAWLSLFWLGEL